MKIYHHNDLDGRCAGAIAWRWGKKNIDVGVVCSCIEVDYKDKVDLTQIYMTEKIAIVDFSFKPEVIEEVLKKTRDIVWIDHHKTAKDYPYQDLPGLRDFSDKGMSGCELAWNFFFPEKSMPRTVELIGDYDKWALKFQPECFQFYEGLKMEDMTPKSEIWDRLFEPLQQCAKDGWVESIINQGRSAIRYRDNYCSKICHDFGHEIELDGHRGYATNFYQFGSKGFGEKMEQYEFCVAYIHDGQRFTVSLYSIKEVDVSEIVLRLRDKYPDKVLSAGGHAGAAGMVTTELLFKKAV